MTALPMEPVESPRLVCSRCAAGEHVACAGRVGTGRMVPDTDPYRERTQFVPETTACQCECRA